MRVGGAEEIRFTTQTLFRLIRALFVPSAVYDFKAFFFFF